MSVNDDSFQRPHWKRLVVFLLRGFITAGLLFMLFEVVVWLHPPALARGLALIDRDLICSASEAFRGAERHSRVYDDGGVIVSRSMLIRSDGAHNLYKTPRGDWWVPKGSEGAVLSFLAQQQHRIYGEGHWGVQPGNVVLDCGANVGMYARTALEAGARRVIAIEPGPENVECLRRNLAREIEEKRVSILPVGVWDREDVLPLYTDPLNSGADSFVIRAPNDRVVNVRLTSIDRLTAELNLTRVDHIKMDIKGATKKALDGARGVLTRDRPTLVIATEEREDDAGEISPYVLSLQPQYKVACGVCSIGAGLKVNPDVLFFRI